MEPSQGRAARSSVRPEVDAEVPIEERRVGRRRQRGSAVHRGLDRFAHRLISVAFADADLGHFSSRRSEEHTSELQSRRDLVCRLLLEKKNTDSQLYDT